MLLPSMGRTARRPSRTVVALALGLVLSLFAGAIVGSVVDAALPPLSDAVRSIHVGGPKSGLYRSVEVAASSRQRGDVVTFTDLCFRIEHNDGAWSEQECFEPPRRLRYREWRTEERGGTTVSTEHLAPQPGGLPLREPVFDPSDIPIDALVEWAKRIGISDSAAVRKELDDMVRIATEGFRARGTRIVPLEHFDGPYSSRGSVRSRSSSLAGWSMLGTTALIWLFVAYMTLRRVRKERSERRAAAERWLADAKAPAEAGAM